MSIVLFACCIYWVFQHFSFHDIMKFFGWFILFYYIVLCVAFIFFHMCNSCKESNQEKYGINPNQTDKKTTSIQLNVQPTTQYPVLGEIKKIISNLTELEKNQDLDKDLFVEFHVLKDKFNSDHQEIVKMLNTLKQMNQFDDNYLESFNHYLDAFKKQQQIIYDNIKQQYTNKLNTINEQLQHFDKT